MFAYLIIIIKLLSIAFTDQILEIRFSQFLQSEKILAFLDTVGIAFVPTSWLSCGAWAYDERYTLLASILLLIILAIWCVLLISMLLSVFWKRSRLFAIKLSCFVLLIDVIASSLAADATLRSNCVIVNSIFLLLALVSLLIANRKFKRN